VISARTYWGSAPSNPLADYRKKGLGGKGTGREKKVGRKGIKSGRKKGEGKGSERQGKRKQRFPQMRIDAIVRHHAATAASSSAASASDYEV